jgi:hypothetical protein
MPFDYVFEMGALQLTSINSGLNQKERAMRYTLSLFLLFNLLTSCDRNRIDPSISSCAYLDTKLTRTDQFVKEAPAIIITLTSQSQQVSCQIMRGGTSAALGSCNLPLAFAKDSLKVTVSGYLLTFLGLEVMNLTPLPFEITDIKLR